MTSHSKRNILGSQFKLNQQNLWHNVGYNENEFLPAYFPLKEVKFWPQK